MSRISIFGDNCIDAYWVGEVKGLSAEAPVPVTKQTRGVVLPGMAGNVEALIQGLGEVDVELLQPSTPHLPVKNRLVTENGQQLARWDIEDFCLPLQVEDFEQFENREPPTAIIVCDYGKGAVDALTVEKLLTYSSAGIPLFVDTKGDPFRWLGGNVTFFPNQSEYTAWKEHYDWMPSVVAKKGALGLDYMKYGEVEISVPGQEVAVRNVCGAGDAVVAAFVWAAVRGVYTLPAALELANEAAASLVEKPFDERGIYLFD